MEIKQEFHKFEINIDVSSRGAPPKPGNVTKLKLKYMSFKIEELIYKLQ